MSSKLAKVYHGNVKEVFPDIFGKVVEKALKLVSEGGKEVFDLKKVGDFVGGNKRVGFWFWFCRLIILVENLPIYNEEFILYRIFKFLFVL